MLVEVLQVTLGCNAQTLFLIVSSQDDPFSEPLPTAAVHTRMCRLLPREMTPPLPLSLKT